MQQRRIDAARWRPYAPRVRPGNVLADRFTIEREAGSGGMGTVYRARDAATGEPVALKVLHRRAPSELQRFEREARLLSELGHAHVVRYVAHGTTPIGEPWLAMEWIDGEDLDARLTRQGLTILEALAVCEGVASALATAHARGIVHRDVKPSNVMLRGNVVSDPVLLDFGIARDRGTKGVTIAGSMLGTLGYMSPEQARGEPDIDARADVFSLGCILFECLTGRAAFIGENFMAVLGKVLVADVPRVIDLRPDIPASLDALVASMLSKERERRPRDALFVMSALLAAREGGIVELGRARPSERPPSLTAGEQRLVSVLAIASPEEPDAPDAVQAAETIVSSPSRDSLREVAESAGARLEVLADGSSIAMCTGSGSANDEAQRAARCALAIRRAHPNARMALSTGRARLGERLPVGEAIDRAASLLGSAREAEIRVDEITAGFLDARFELGGDARGLYLRAERPVVEAKRLLLGRETACVGRDRELGLLTDTFDECVGDEVARAVVVTGAAGIGKSRLRYELVRRVRARVGEAEKSEVWVARGDPIAAASPFALVAQLVRAAAALSDDEAREVSLAKLRARVARHVEPNAVERVAAFLAELIALPSELHSEDASFELAAAREDAVLMGDQMRRAFDDFLAAECRERPLLVIVEDLQWGDLPSVRCFDAALRLLRERPFMVVALARPELVDVFPNLWADRSTLHIALGPLGRKAAEAMVRGALGDTAPPSVVAELVERGEGNPFFLEELVRAVSERGSSALPPTVLAMVQARLDELDVETRRVLRAASVFGQTFWSHGVAALLGGDARTAYIEPCLDTLVEREIIVRKAPVKFEGLAELSFRHGLVRDAAYAMLTDEDRVLGHRLAGAWLESVGERDARALAEHFERGGDHPRTIAAYRRAAEHAVEGSDYGVALACVERALQAGASGESRGVLLGLAAEAHHWRADFAAVESFGAEALALLRPGTAQSYAVLGRLAIAMGRRGGTERLVALVSAIPEPETTEAAGAYVVALSHLAAQLLFVGRYDLANAVIERIDACGSDVAMVGWVHDARATRAMIDGDSDGCLTAMQAARDAFLRAGDMRNACIQHGYVGYGYLEVGELLEAERALRAAFEEAERLGMQHTASTAKHNLGRALSQLGRLDEARDVEKQAVAEFVQQGDKRLEGGARRYLAQIHLLRGELDDAEREARASLDALEAVPPMRAVATATLAEVLLARGASVDALDLARDAGDTLDQLGTIEEGAGAIRLTLADALLANGDLGAARTVITIARDLLLESAARVADPSRRAKMLELIPEHARIVARARQLGA